MLQCKVMLSYQKMVAEYIYCMQSEIKRGQVNKQCERVQQLPYDLECKKPCSIRSTFLDVDKYHTINYENSAHFILNNIK